MFGFVRGVLMKRSGRMPLSEPILLDICRRSRYGVERTVRACADGEIAERSTHVVRV